MKKFFVILFIVLGIGFVYGNKLIDFVDELKFSSDSQTTANLSVGSVLASPIFIESKDDKFYFLSPFKDPNVTLAGNILDSKSVDFQSVESEIVESLKSSNHLIEVLSSNEYAQNFLSFEINGFSLYVENPNYFDFRVEDSQHSDFIDVFFNHDISNDYKDFVSIQPNVDLDIDIDGPGYILFNTKNWTDVDYKITLEPGFFKNFNYEKSIVLRKNNSFDRSFNTRFSKLNILNDNKNSISYSLRREEYRNIDFKLYSFDDFQDFYNDYSSQSRYQKYDFESKLKKDVIRLVDNPQINFSLNDRSVNLDNLDNGYYLLRNNSDFTYIQKVDYDIFYAKSNGEFLYYVYDFNKNNFVNFEVNLFGDLLESKDKLLKIDVENLIYSGDGVNLKFNINNQNVLVNEYLGFYKNIVPLSVYSNISLDKPKYKLGDTINGNFLMGDFSKEFANNKVNLYLSESYMTSEVSKDGYISSQSLDLSTYGSSDFSLKIPDNLNSNLNYIYLNFFWDGKRVADKYVELLKIDKAQTVLEGSFDKDFYLPGEDVTLNFSSYLFNGTEKSNMEVKNTSYSNMIFNDKLGSKIFITDENGKFTQTFKTQPHESLYSRMYSPIHSVYFNLMALDKKGLNSYLNVFADYYLTLIDVNFFEDRYFKSNQIDYGFNLNKVIPGDKDNLGDLIPNKDLTVEILLSGNFSEEFIDKNQSLISKKDHLDEKTFFKNIKPLNLAPIDSSNAEEIEINLEEFDNESLKDFNDFIKEKYPKKSDLIGLRQEFLDGTLNSQMLFDYTEEGFFEKDVVLMSKDIKTDENGKFEESFNLFKDPKDLEDFAYLNLKFKVSYVEDGIKKTYFNRLNYSKEGNFRTGYYKNLKVLNVDGKKNSEKNGYSDRYTYKLGSEITFEIQDFSKDSSYILMMQDANGITSEFIDTNEFVIKVKKEHLPNFDLGLIEVNKDGDFYIHNNAYLRHENLFEIKNLNSQKVFSPGQEYELNLELLDKSLEDTFVNVKMVDKKLFGRYDYETGISDSIFGRSYRFDFGNFFGRSSSFGGKGGCFLEDSKILMSDGSLKNIQNVNVGDSVLTFSEDKIGIEQKAIIQGLQEFFVKEYLIVNDELKITPNHQVYSNGEFKSIYLVEIGDKMIKDGKEILVEKVENVTLESPIKVYNFTVSPFHTYIVDGYFVHNEGKGDSLMTVKDIRKNFKDVAFFKTFFPKDNLISEKFALPDDITTYKLFVSAFDKKLFKTGFLDDEVSIDKDIIVEPLFPSKVNKGDKLLLDFGVFGKESKNLDNAFIELNDQRYTIENPGSKNQFKYDFNKEGEVKYLLGAESKNANDYYESKINVVEQNLTELAPLKKGLQISENASNRVVVQNKIRNFAYLNALDLFKEIKSSDISNLEERFAMQNLNSIIYNYDSYYSDSYVLVDYFDLLRILDLDLSELKGDQYSSKLKDNDFLSAFYDMAFRQSISKFETISHETFDAKYFLQDFSVLNDKAKILYFILASNHKVFYFDELEKFKGNNLYYFAKAYLLKNYNKNSGNFRLNYSLNGENSTEFSENGEVLFDLYKQQDLDFSIDFEGQDLIVYSADYQDLDTTNLKRFVPKVNALKDGTYNLTFDFNSLRKDIFNDNSSFEFSMVPPTGFELIDSWPKDWNCGEFIQSYGDRFNVYLNKYYNRGNTKFECDLKIELSLRPNFKGQINLPATLLRSSLNKFVSDPVLIDVQ